MTNRFAVLCPPHLVDQWTGELRTKFDLDAVAVTAASAARLERDLPASQTLFHAYPRTVVSLDYIKADKRRDSFARACPPLVLVDEADGLRRHPPGPAAALRAAQASYGGRRAPRPSRAAPGIATQMEITAGCSCALSHCEATKARS